MPSRTDRSLVPVAVLMAVGCCAGLAVTSALAGSFALASLRPASVWSVLGLLVVVGGASLWDRRRRRHCEACRSNGVVGADPAGDEDTSVGDAERHEVGHG
jgi:hypothetical protein